MTIECSFCDWVGEREDAVHVGPMTHCPDCRPGSDDDADSENLQGGSGGANPTPDTLETTIRDAESAPDSDTGDGLPAYAEILREAQDLADRERWEPVEESALRTVLERHGIEDLLDGGVLARTGRWRVTDMSEDGEEPRRRWYYAAGDEPRPDEFRRFHELLTEAAPDEYEPHYFRVARAGKDPATQFGSWKTDEARLTVDEALDWMEQGGNIGIAGRGECKRCDGEAGLAGDECGRCDGTGELFGPLVNVDIDDDEETTPGNVPDSLRARSRSRTGWHTWYFDKDGEIPNIPTDKYGEVRTDWQYVVAPGSFVASAREEIPNGADDPGYYTVETADPVASIQYDDLPKVFIEAAEAVEDDDSEDDTGAWNDTGEGDGRHDHDGDNSAVFDIDADELVSESDASERFPSVFHDSSTDANMSVSDGKLHCWRHNVAHGGLQALATLSDQVKYGCQALGKAHKNSNAGKNRLKGDWRLVWAAWHEAKQRGKIPKDDPVPYRALVGVAVEDGLVDTDDLVKRDSDTGEVVEDDSSGTYLALPPGTYDGALAHAREEYGVDPGREPVSSADSDDDSETYDSDPREVEATVDPRRAWDAAGRVTREDLDADLRELEDVGDVARAVALAEGIIDDCEAPLNDQYPEAYRLAREEYGAPLPEYYTTADTIAEYEAIGGVVGELTFWDLNTDALESEITGRDGEVGGDAVRALDPCWRESESGESVLVFDSGTVWDADTERVIDMVRFVGLEIGVIDAPTDRPSYNSDEFVTAYGAARDEYGAPLPRWEPAHDGSHDTTAQLPASEDLLKGCDLDGVDPDALEAARAEVEALVRDAVEDSETPRVITSLPATGKTTSTIKIAAETPLSYLAPRKELQQQAVDKAEQYGVDALILPVLSEATVRDEFLSRAVGHVREYGKDRLRDRWAIVSEVFDSEDDEDDAPDPADIFAESEDDEVDLNRATCPTAEGAHGVAWALAVHVARELGYTPREIHTEASGLFGASPPCSEHDADCPYTQAWDDVSDADDPPDLLVGSYIHAHVESVRTAYDRNQAGNIERDVRPVVLDEYPGQAFESEYGEEALDYATWLSRCLREDVEDRRDMYDAELFGDEWVRSWLDGEGDEIDAVGEAITHLGSMADLMEARNAAAEILDEVDTELLESLDLADALAFVSDESNDAVEAYDRLSAALDAVLAEHPGRSVAQWIDEDVLTPLVDATGGLAAPDLDTIDSDALPIAGDLAALVDRAVGSAEQRDDGARELLSVAVSALQGGREGCRALAAWADDGYAHPNAHHFLTAVITPTDADGNREATRIETDGWAFDDGATDGTVLETVRTGEKAVVTLDRNDHGAILKTPPSRVAGNGEDTPLVGLDATGRADLWGETLLEDVETADIHETPSERVAFLEDALSLRVIQAADRPRAYEGDPTTKDTDGDAALLQAMSDEYAGVEAPRRRGEDAVPVGDPAAITTKGVRQVLEADPRLDDAVAAWENFGNLTGANDLGNHRLGAVLGSQHYGDDAIERFAALAGREIDTERAGDRGADLDYGDPLANTYLQHMREDQVMQAILRFARGDSGATVVARTSALREDLPVVGRGQVVDTWSDSATAVAREYRRHGDGFTVADVADSVDVTTRQVRRILNELAGAGYIQRVSSGDGVASVYEPLDEPDAGEVDLPERDDAVAQAADPGRSSHSEYYTWNVRVFGGETLPEQVQTDLPARRPGAPPSPSAVAGVEPPG